MILNLMVVVHNNLRALGVFLTGEAQAVLKSNSSSGHFFLQSPLLPCLFG